MYLHFFFFFFFFKIFITWSVADFCVCGNVTGLRRSVDIWHEHSAVSCDLCPHPAAPERPQVSGRLTRCTVHEWSVQEMGRRYHLRVGYKKSILIDQPIEDHFPRTRFSVNCNAYAPQYAHISKWPNSCPPKYCSCFFLKLNYLPTLVFLPLRNINNYYAWLKTI